MIIVARPGAIVIQIELSHYIYVRPDLPAAAAAATAGAASTARRFLAPITKWYPIYTGPCRYIYVYYILTTDLFYR